MKKFLTALTSLTFVAFPICVSTSCANQGKNIPISKIELFPSSHNIRPGESMLVRAVIQPSGERYNNLLWNIDGRDGVSISSTGQLHVSDETIIEKPEKITITAANPKDTSVSASTFVYLLPTATGDFNGFLDNTLWCLDRSHNIVPVPIIQTDEFTYVVSRNIDVFMRDILPLPEQFESFIKFVPLIPGDNQYMSFDLAGKFYAYHSLSWIDYDNASWTETIPLFETSNMSQMFDSIVVSFACDPRVTLTINFNIWQNQSQQISTGIMSYIPVSEEDTHEIVYSEEGIYSMALSCPSYETQGQYVDEYNSIYVYRPYHEYTEFDDFVVRYSSSIPEEIKNMLTIELSEPEIVERKFDHFKAYRFKVTYSFDLTKREHTADYYHYDDLLLFSISIYDPFIPDVPACRCDARIVWI